MWPVFSNLPGPIPEPFVIFSFKGGFPFSFFPPAQFFIRHRATKGDTFRQTARAGAEAAARSAAKGPGEHLAKRTLAG